MNITAQAEVHEVTKVLSIIFHLRFHHLGLDQQLHHLVVEVVGKVVEVVGKVVEVVVEVVQNIDLDLQL